MNKFKFKVGDKVTWQRYMTESICHGIIVETNSGMGNKYCLVRFKNFQGHNGFTYTNSGKPYATNDHYYVEPQNLKLDYEAQDEKEEVNIRVRESRIEDIRVDTKVVTIPQHRDKPKKVTCKIVVVVVNGVEYESVCMPEDEFDLARGIEVATLKAAFGSTKAYNKWVRDNVRFYKLCEQKREEEKRIEAKREKDKARKIARKAKRAEAERQARVDEMKEAYLAAMVAYNSIDVTDKVHIEIETEVEN